MGLLNHRTTEYNYCRLRDSICLIAIARIFNTRLHLLISGIIASVALTACGPPTLDAKSMQALFEDRSQPVFDSYAVDDRSIYFAELPSPGKLLVIFLHGTPGSWDNWVGYMADKNLATKFHLIAVDRPGFGLSAAKGVILSLQKQAEYLKPLLQRNTTEQRILLVGHSLGASIAVRMAMEYPEQLCGLVLVAPSLDPVLERPRWYNRFAASPLLRWMIPNEMQLANDEVMVLEAELTEMLPLWDTLKTPVTVIQGDKDRLVRPANADFAEQVLKNIKPKIIRVADAGHFILWKRPEIIRDAILEALDHNCQANRVKQRTIY